MSSLKLTPFTTIKTDPVAPYLLGLSAGPDSMALFHLLLEEKIPFHVVHIDHSWRESSSKEAEFVAHYCKEKNIPFHLYVLSPPNEKNNLEDKGRKERLSCFSHCIKKENLSALMLAHHADDQAETVLKRVLESSFISNLSALRASSQFGDLTILRPLLPYTKKQLLAYLHENKVPYFEDPTNYDTRFLRAKMRQELLPQLSKDFGKNVTTSLCRLGKQAQELADFIDQLLAPILAKLRFEENCIYSAPDDELLSTPFLLKAFLRRIFSLLSVAVSEHSIDMILFHLQKNDRKVLEVKGMKIIIQNKIISFFPQCTIIQAHLHSLWLERSGR